MSKNNGSRELDSHLEKHIPDYLEKKLASLKAIGIDDGVFEKFHTRIEQILTNNPGSEQIISSEIGKVSLAMENTMKNYKRQFRSILELASNNPDFSGPDESLIA